MSLGGGYIQKAIYIYILHIHTHKKNEHMYQVYIYTIFLVKFSGVCVYKYIYI